MKNMKTRIAAAACAAITAVCGAQALSASAFNYGHPYSGNTQSWCQNPQNMGYNLHAWQSYGWPENSTFTQTVKAGTCVGKGFTTSHISSYTTSTTLRNSIGWVRYLANSHFGFDAAKAAWLELPKTDFTASGYYRRATRSSCTTARTAIMHCSSPATAATPSMSPRSMAARSSGA